MFLMYGQLQVAMQIVRGLGESQSSVMYCRERVQRVVTRGNALVPVLQALQRGLSTASVEVSVAQSLGSTLVTLASVSRPCCS
jgi:hypothetical protein